MDYLELMKIKAYQKEFKDLFGKELVIDFSAMKGITVSANSLTAWINSGSFGFLASTKAIN
jgi:hypothetical protein